MRHSFHDTKTGTEVDEHTALDANRCVKDGYTMRTRLMLIDGVPVDRDPSQPLTDEQRAADIDVRNARLSDAWRNPAPLLTQAAPVVGDAGDVYERHDRRLQDAWRQTA